MVSLRDIINAATPGPWRLLKSQRAEFIIIADRDDDYPLWVASSTVDRERDAHFIAAYSPDHALLIEEFIEAHAEFVRAHASLDTFHRYSVALDNLNHYRRERGYNG